jgi:hypothetical protein
VDGSSINYSASKGYFVVKIEDSGSWKLIKDAYTVVRWKSLTQDSVELAVASKTDHMDAVDVGKSTYDEAIEEYTEEKGYFVRYYECGKIDNFRWVLDGDGFDEGSWESDVWDEDGDFVTEEW